MRYKVLSILTLAVLSLAATSPAIMPGQDDTYGAFGGVGKVMITDLGGYSFQRGTAFAISERHAITVRHVVTLSGGPYGDLYPTNQISFQFCGDDTTPIHAEQALEPPAVIYFQQLRQVVILTFPEGTFEEWYEPYYPSDPVDMFITLVGTGRRGILRGDAGVTTRSPIHRA